MAQYESNLAEREAAILARRGPTHLRDLTFATTVEDGSSIFRTIQAELEAGSSSKRKNSTYASHGIHRYKGKFYPQLGRCLINLSSEKGQLVVDPFSGSGTVGLEATLLERRFHGIELSPVGAATARAKIAVMTIPSSSLQVVSEKFAPLAHVGDLVNTVWSEFHPSTHEELSSWFPAQVLARLSRVLGAIREVDESGFTVEAQAARVCLSDLIREVSHQDPSDLRIRRRAIPLVDAPVERLFFHRWNALVHKVRAAKAVLGDVVPEAVVVSGDAGESGNWPGGNDAIARPIDAVVSSPPYAAALPYLDTDRLSLAAVFGADKLERKALEALLVGSREIGVRATRDWEQRLRDGCFAALLPETTVDFLVQLADDVAEDPAAGFRRRQAPAVLTRYFVAMSRVMSEIAGRIRPGGEVWYVLGDSRTTVAGVPRGIPTVRETAALAQLHGLQHVESIPITVTRDNMRHSRNAITDNTLLHFRAP